MDEKPPPKRNCWEFFQCRRDIFTPAHLRQESLCPVSLISVNNTVNSGVNSGRRCWRVEGTFCAHEGTRGDFLFKELHCPECEFRKQVKEEEGDTFVP